MGLIYDDGKYVTLTDILGCRGRLRRHGLQGRRHEPSSSPPSSSTPRSTASRPRSWPRRCEQAKEARLEILEVMNAAIAEPRAEVGATRPEDHQLRDPDRQDRRGHRARRARSSTPSRPRPAPTSPSTTTAWSAPCRIGSSDSGAVAEAERQIRLILNPPHRRGRRRPTRVGSSTSPSSVRSSTSSRAVTAWSTSPRWVAASASTRSRTSLDLGRRDRGQGRRRRPERQGLAQPDHPALGGGGGGGSSERRQRSVRRLGSSGDGGTAPARETVSFEDAFDAEVREEFGDLGPGRAPGGAVAARGGDRGRDGGAWRRSRVAAAAGAEPTDRSRLGRLAGPRPIRAAPTTGRSGLRVVTERMPERHARSASAAGSRVGGRDEAPTLDGRVALPRAPAVQGHRAARSGREIAEADRGGRRRDQRLHRPGAHRVLRAAAGDGGRASGSTCSSDVLTAPAFRRRRGRVRAPGDPRGARS